MEFPFTQTVEDEQSTKKIAAEFAALLNGGDVVVLNGDLGTGKTFFVKEVCKLLGADEANSPSFAIVNEYEGKRKIYHFDFYRIKKLEELYDIGFEDYLNDRSAIVFIEWGDMFDEILPDNKYIVALKHMGDTKREITIEKND